MDPRIPDTLEVFPFKLTDDLSIKKVEWIVNDKPVGYSNDNKQNFFWPLTRGKHNVYAKVWLAGNSNPTLTQSVNFYVK